MSSHLSPPRARLVLRIGVTGHRPDKLDPAAYDSAAAELAATLPELRSTARRIRDETDAYDSGGEPLLCIVSALAEGADRLAAEVGLAAGAELHAVLPFSRETYQTDFADPASVAAFQALLGRSAAVFELDGDREDAGHAYEAAGLAVLQYSDVIVAVWNGQAAEGRGGTAEIIGCALAARMPVIWIDSAGRQPACLLEVGGDEGGPQTAPLSALPDRLAALLQPPAPVADHHGKTAGDLRRTYFEERPPGWSWGGLFTAFANLVIGGWPKGLLQRNSFVPDAAADAWRRELDCLPSAVQTMLADRLAVHHGWADALAQHYAALHRSSFVANYLLGAVAVFFALLGVAAHGWETAATALELGVIAVIVVNTVFGRRRRWHQRWIDYRQLAEHIRHIRFLAPLGLSVPELRGPAHSEATTPGNSWIAWHLRAIVRQLGAPSVRLDETYRAGVRRLLLDSELNQQIAYHHRNAHRMETLDHRLHYVGDALFTATFLACAAHLFIDHHSPLAGWLTLVAAVGPATGAALYGIRNHGEFARVAQRSASMESALAALAGSLNEPSPSTTLLKRVASRAAEIMIAETVDWRFVFRGKPLTLPG